jgi:hypothetical protein
VVPESLFKRQAQKYEEERIERLQAVETLEKRVRGMKQDTDNASTWTKLMKRYTELETLDSETLLLLIDRIIVSEAQIVGNKRVCDVRIVYNYVGDVNRLGLERMDGEAVAAYERKAV